MRSPVSLGALAAGAEMQTAKQSVRDLLDDLPDNSTFEDIQYHIYVRQRIERGLQDLKAGRVLSQKEAERRMAKWLKPGLMRPGRIWRPWPITLARDSRYYAA